MVNKEIRISALERFLKYKASDNLISSDDFFFREGKETEIEI